MRLSLCYGYAEQGAGAEKGRTESVQKENENLCSLPIVKPCENAII